MLIFLNRAFSFTLIAALVACNSTEYQSSKPIDAFLVGIPAEANSPPSNKHTLHSITCKRNLLPARIQQPSSTHSWHVRIANHTVNVMAFAQSEKSVYFRAEGVRGGTINANMLVDSEGEATVGELRCENIVILPNSQ